MFVKLTLHPSGKSKFYNTQHIKAFQQVEDSTILELSEGVEVVKEKAEDIFRMLNEEPKD